MFTLHCTKPGAGALAAFLTAASASAAALLTRAADALSRARPWLASHLPQTDPAIAEAAAGDSALIALLTGAEVNSQTADDACAGCGWFDSSHALQHGLCVLEHANAEGLAGDLPLADWLALQLSGWRPAPPA